MGFNPPVPQQDSNTEIRVAVLLSLLFQVILIFAGPRRKRSSSAISRFVIWSCYLLADWVADLALGLLLNNMGNIGGGGGGSVVGSITISSIAGLKPHIPHGDAATSGSIGGGGGGSIGGGGSGSSSPIIFAFWAPFLLLHLGGPDTITAYSLEDNELWLRHLVGFLFELLAAAVVFFCSLGNNPMVVATPLMFIAGIIKYVERTYSLFYGSTDGFPVAILGIPDVRSTNIPKLMQAYSSRQRAGLVVELATLTDRSSNMGHGYSVEDADDGRDELSAYDLFISFRAIFVNGVVTTRNRMISEEFYRNLGKLSSTKAFDILEIELNYMYDMLYTKMPVLSSTTGYVFRFVGFCCIISSFIIFASHGRASMLPADIGITYALLAIAVVLEVAALVKLLFSDWTLVYIHHSKHFKWLYWLVICIRRTGKKWRTQKRATWSGKVQRMNLIKHSLRTVQWNDRHGFLLGKVPKVANKFSPKPSIKSIKKGGEKYQHLLTFIFKRVEDIVTKIERSSDDSEIETEPEQWKREQKKKACQARGDRALRELLGSPKKFIKDNVIFQSVIDRDFDESLLLWHIATDVCYSMDKDVGTSAQNSESQNIEKMMTVSKCISEYLLYLLIKKPEMTSETIGIGRLRYNNTYEGAKLLFRSTEHMRITDHKMACRVVHDMGNNTTFEDCFIKGDRTKTVLFNASVLARALKKSFTTCAMWEVIAHVWMEMLTFTASHTQPREHLKNLSHGGELITMVWLFMAHMGMTSSSFEVQEAESINKLIIIDQ